MAMTVRTLEPFREMMLTIFAISPLFFSNDYTEPERVRQAQERRRQRRATETDNAEQGGAGNA